MSRSTRAKAAPQQPSRSATWRALAAFAAVSLSLGLLNCSKATIVTPDACLDNQFRCEGSALKRCNGNRTGYDLALVCPAEQSCSETLGACVDPPKEPPPPVKTTCTPKSTEDCFEGRTALAGVGACKKGKRTCADDGSAFGACVGEGKPSAQSCTAGNDEDCDGVAGCTGDVRSATALGVRASLAKSDAEGNVFIASGYSSASTLLGSALPQGQQGDLFVAKLDPSGALLWKYTLAGIGNDSVRDIVVDADGGVVLLGIFATGNQGDLKIGGTTLRTDQIGIRELFAAKLNKSGAPQWATHVDGFGYDWADVPAKLALGSAGNVFVFTSAKSTLEVRWGADQSGRTDISIPNGTEGLYLLELTGGGTFVRSYAIDCIPTFDGESAVTAFASRIGGPGAINTLYAAARCKSASWAPNNNPRGIDSPAEYSLIKLNQVASGSFIPDATAPGTAAAIAVNAKDQIFTGGDAPVSGRPSFSVRRLDPAIFTPVWIATARNAQATSSASSISLDSFDNILAAGPCSGFLALDPNSARGDLTGLGICVAKYDSAGAFIWAKTLAATTTDLGTGFGELPGIGLAVGPIGQVSVARQQIWMMRP